MHRILSTALLSLGLAAAAPAAAVTTFATFTGLDGANVRWVNDGGGTAGTGGSLFTTATANSGPVAPRNVAFSFLQPALAPAVTNLTAAFLLTATATNSPATLVNTPGGTLLVQSGLSGSFSFTSTSVIAVGNTVFATGSNLLSGSFSDASIAGTRLGGSGDFTDSAFSGGTVTFTSDFLDFGGTSLSDFHFTLSSITPVLQALPINLTPNRALRNFRAGASGGFLTDPEPIVLADPIPEPQTWLLMVVGFGLIGVSTRRQTAKAA